jgi:hypothetical protein
MPVGKRRIRGFPAVNHERIMGDGARRPVDAGRLILNAVQIRVKQPTACMHDDHHFVPMIVAIAPRHHLQHGN